MNETELRVGNVISIGGDKMVKVVEIGTYTIRYLDNTYNDNFRAFLGYEYIKPIELTEEILLKCGFENAENFNTNKVFSKNRLYLTKWIDKDFFIADWSYKKIKNIQHLHQLQNLYFYLTDEELEIQL